MKLALAVAAIALAACGGRAHFEPAYGRAYRAQFAAQRQPLPGGKAARAAPGLDAQEASIIAGSYRRSLAPKEMQQSSEQPILVVTPQQAGAGAGARALPLPSVPKD